MYFARWTEGWTWRDSAAVRPGDDARLLYDTERVPSWHALIARDRGEDWWEVIVPSDCGCRRFPDEASARRAAEEALGIDHSEVDG